LRRPRRRPSIGEREFTPATITVKRGASITVTNARHRPHRPADNGNSSDGRLQPAALTQPLELAQGTTSSVVAEAVRAGHPVGVMFHHAVMTAAEADDFLGLIARHERARPRSMHAVSAARVG